MRRALTLALGLAPLAAAAQEPADRRGAVHEEAVVERVVVDAHVVNADGTPIPSLGPSDFVLTVDGQVVPLEAVDWLPAGTPEFDPGAAPPEASGSAAVSPDVPPGRVIILFFETDHEISRLHGLLRMSVQARRFLGTLESTDRVAVVSFDSHLKLRQDFTSDRAKLESAIEQAIRKGDAPPGDGAGHPSLARFLDDGEARRCATPERALELVARAAGTIPGGKSMLFFGWGLGTFGGVSGPTASEQLEWSDAMHRMAEARINIFTLDVTDADYHSLEGSIQQIADLTGGHYEKTHLFPELVMDRVTRAISGRYVLVFVKPQRPRGDHEITLTLANGRKGRVFARQYYSDR